MTDASKIPLVVNGTQHFVDPEAHSSLLEFLRIELKLTGTKTGCSMGDCGACTVIVDGNAVQSCQLGLSSVSGDEIKTVEAVVETSLGGQIAETLTKHDAAQCGYCLPGIVVAAYGGFLKSDTPVPCEVLARNICRCGTHSRILKALQEVINARGSAP